MRTIVLFDRGRVDLLEDLRLVDDLLAQREDVANAGCSGSG
jgi:hypothetical protein